MTFFVDTADIEAIAALSSEGIPTNATPVFSPSQALLVASVRSPNRVVETALLGADVATIPPDVIKQLVQHPLTGKGLAACLADWNELQGR